MNNEQIKNFIIKSREDGIRDEDIVTFLKNKGIDLAKMQQPQSFRGLEKAPFQATGEENIITGTAKTIGNIPRSTFELGKNVAQAVLNPIETAKSIGTVVKGAGAKVGEKLLENTDIGQTLLRQAKERGVDVAQDETGRFVTRKTPELETFNKVLQFFGDRYGSIDKLKETVIEDPAGFLADLATVTTGAGALTSKTGQLANLPKVTQAGQAISSTAQAMEPITAVSRGVSKAVSATAKPITSLAPDGKLLQAGEIAKALELTNGDLQNIAKKTGNNVSDFIVERNLLRETPEEIVFALDDVKTNTMTLVRDEIAKVPKVYTPSEIPSVRNGMQVILNGVDEVPGLEDVATEIRTLLNKDQYTLSDVQRAKELIDQNSDIYTKFGETKASSQAKGLVNLRQDIRAFIEKEVDTATNGQTNIRQLNNDVQTAKEISDAVVARAQRGLLRQNISLSDWIIGLGGLATDPVLGLTVLGGKKILENPSVRLNIAKALQAQPVESVKRALTEIKNKNISPQSEALIGNIVDNIRKSLPVVESGAAALPDNEEIQQK